jgi:subtilisin family serine protease
MPVAHMPSLDPRLQRLLSRSSDAERSDDMRSGLVEAPADPAAPPTVRVLVLLATPDIPAILDPASLIRITERVVSVDVPVDQLEQVAGDPGVLYVEGGRRLLPSLMSSVSATRADTVKLPPTSLDGTGVVVGIIDYGFDYTLDDFRDASGATRVAFLWDQSLARRPGESAPVGFPYGVEYTRAQIDAALVTPDPFASVRHLPGAGSHGTHVAGIAAGNGRSNDASFAANRHVGVAHGATIIFVQPYTTGTDTFTDSVRVADAIAYVYARARQLGLPCVINMSLNQNGGSHDGESVVERAIDQLTAEPGRVFVCAAGNEHTWRGHASGKLATGDSRVLRLGVGGWGTASGVDRTPNEIELWHSSRDAFTITIRSPDGDAIGPIAAGAAPREPIATASGNQVLVRYERFTPLNGESQIYIELSRGSAGSVRRGGWELVLDAVRTVDGRFDAFIERDLRDPGNDFADQAYFVGADFDAAMTLGTPATTRRGIAVANYDHVTLAPHVASSRGPTRDRRSKPEIAAPGTNIVASCALGSRQVAGETVPVRTSMTGTSMSAPHVAGIVALLLQRRPRLTAEQVAAILVATADPPQGMIGFDDAWGFGRVNAAAAVAALP